MTAARPGIEIWVWRHPRADGAAGRCIGRTDLGVDRRKAKRLAGRIRAAARRHGLERVIWTSPLRRAVEVGRVLRALGWRHRIDSRLAELDFGRWDGRAWTTIAPSEVAAWEADFLHHAPGGGESQAMLLARVAAFVRARAGAAAPCVVLAVSHAGWIAALEAGRGCADAARWPRPVPAMGLRRVRIEAEGDGAITTSAP
jgi:alpha-ribazole phosphatase